VTLLTAGCDYTLEDNGKMSGLDYIKNRHPNSLAVIQKAINAGPTPNFRAYLKQKIHNNVVRIDESKKEQRRQGMALAGNEYD